MNPDCRRAALEALKPTRKEMERGLALHRDSVVVDAYALGARGRPREKAMDAFAAQLAATAEGGATAQEITDLAEESVPVFNATDPAARAEYRRHLETAGVTCIFQNAGLEVQDPARLVRRVAQYTLMTDLDDGFVKKAVAPAGILRAKREGRHCLYLNMCAVPLAQGWESMEGELDLVRIFFMLGVRMMHLTYNRRNMIGSGCGEEKDAGLSDFGRAVVREMNRVGLIVDIAHSGQETSRDAARVSSRPVVASHSTCRDLHDFYRGKTDRTIRALADSGGYIGICCVGRFLGRDCGIVSFLDHVEHAVKLVGADHVAIGTDLFSTAEGAEFEKRITDTTWHRVKKRKNWEALWPENPSDPDPDLVARASPTLKWTNWPLFTVGLVQRGYSDDEIRKIIGGNALRVAGECLSGTAYGPG